MPGSNFAVGHSRRFRDARDRSGLRLYSLDGWRLVIRIDGAGRSTGGGLFSRGHVYKLLSNPTYVGRIAHKGEIYEGHHPPIVTQDLWDEVQQSLSDHLGAARTKRTRQSSDALLAGKLHDDAGNRMSPTWARKGVEALALLCLAGGSARRQEQSGIDPARSGRRFRNSRDGGPRQAVPGPRCFTN